MVTRGDVDSDDEGNGGISDAAETEAESTRTRKPLVTESVCVSSRR